MFENLATQPAIAGGGASGSASVSPPPGFFFALSPYLVISPSEIALPLKQGCSSSPPRFFWSRRAAGKGDAAKRRFVVGINDDVTHTSLDFDEAFDTVPDGAPQLFSKLVAQGGGLPAGPTRRPPGGFAWWVLPGVYNEAGPSDNPASGIIVWNSAKQRPRPRGRLCVDQRAVFTSRSSEMVSIKGHHFLIDFDDL